jgi:hypothetical protein
VNTLGQHRDREAGVLTVLLALPCAAAVTGSVMSGLDSLITRGLLVMGVLVVLGVTARLIARWVRERQEDRADAFAAAAWRAAHPQYDEHRRHEHCRHDVGRAGVA